MPVPQEGIAAIDIERVQFTIDKYFLDERVLNMRREQTWRTARDLYNSYQNALADAKSTNSVASRTKAELELKQLREMLLPKAEFSSVAKESLCKLGDIMAIRIACS
ncbi:hypothetical protein [Edwardsiella piscicida]